MGHFSEDMLNVLAYANGCAAAKMHHEYVIKRDEKLIDLCDKKNIEYHKLMIDKLGKEALLEYLDVIDMHAVIVLGEGEKDDSHGFLYGESIGGAKSYSDAQYDAVIDQVEGTSRIIKGEDGKFLGTMCVQLYAPRNSILPLPGTYGLQAAVSSKAKCALDISKSISENAKNIADAYGCKISDLHFAFINRARSNKDISSIIDIGVPAQNITKYEAGSIEQTMRLAYADLALSNKNLILWSVNGTPEGIISAAIVKAIGGDFQMTINPEYEKDQSRIEVINSQAKERGIDISSKKIYSLDEIIRSNCAVFATGITDSACLGYVESNFSRGKMDVNMLPRVTVFEGKFYPVTIIMSSLDGIKNISRKAHETTIIE